MTCTGMGMPAHGVSRAVSGVVGPKVSETGLLRRSSGRCLGVLSWRVESMNMGAKGTVVFTPGRRVP